MKKTLIFNGSPRKNGYTARLIGHLAGELEGEVKVVDAYRADIRPCLDCRYCFKQDGCCVKDEMQELFPYIAECDHIILASPIYFGELSGQLLAVLSRLQTYFGARIVRKKEPIPKEKTGGIILIAGSFGPREKSEDTALFLLEQLRTSSLGTVYLGYTDREETDSYQRALEEVSDLAAALNGHSPSKRRGDI